MSVIAGYPTKVAPLRQNLELLLFGSEGYHTQSAWRSVLVVTCIVAAATAVAAVALDKLGCACCPLHDSQPKVNSARWLTLTLG